MSEEMFQEAVKAARAGQRVKAKDLFTRLIKADSTKLDYWLWMSALVETEKEQIFCLQNAIKIDPNSTAARRGLVVLGALRPEEAGLSAAPVIEEAAIELPSAKPGGGALGGLDVFLSRPRNRQMVMLIGGAIAFLAVVICALAVLPGLLRGLRPTQVASLSNTPTPAPTDTPAPTATITPIATLAPCRVPSDPNPGTPLAAYLCLTQTPTPLALGTDEANILQESFNTIEQAYFNNDWAKIIGPRATAAVAELPENGRLYFYIAEAYRYQGGDTNLREAIKNYDASITRNGLFAPAYWGRALAKIGRKLDPAALRDLETAIQTEPGFVPAYVDRAIYYSTNDDTLLAQADLEIARQLDPDNAAVLANLANVYMDLGQSQLAFDTAQQTLALDAGIALAYYARGRAEYALGQFEAAEKDLSLSYLYIENNIPPEASFRSLLRAKILYNVALGKIGIGDDPAAQALLTQSIEAFKSGYAPAYLARAEVFLRAKAYDQARPDFNAAINLLKPTPNDPALYQAYMGNGLAFLGLDRPDSAVTNFQLVARNQPENFQAFLYWGHALVLSGGARNAGNALEPLTTALGLTQAEADSAQVFYWRAQAYQILKRTAEEIADLTALAALDAKDLALAPTAAARLTEIGPLPTETLVASPTPTRTRTP